MTRINTHVSALVAQNIFGRKNAELPRGATRLSTGLTINSGKDAPAGLIAAEIIRSDTMGIQKAKRSEERARQLRAAADSAVGRVGALLDDIRAPVTHSARSDANLEATDSVAATLNASAAAKPSSQ